MKIVSDKKRFRRLFRSRKNKAHLKHKLFSATAGLLFAIILFELFLRMLGGIFYLKQLRFNINVEPGQEVEYILCIGDSMTASSMDVVDFFLSIPGLDDYAWPSHLEAYLDGRSDVPYKIINKAKPGLTNTSGHFLERIDDYLDEYQPVMVISMVGANDLQESLRRSFLSEKTFFMRKLPVIRRMKLTNVMEEIWINCRSIIIDRGEGLGYRLWLYYVNNCIRKRAERLQSTALSEANEVFRRLYRNTDRTADNYFRDEQAETALHKLARRKADLMFDMEAYHDLMEFARQMKSDDIATEVMDVYELLAMHILGLERSLPELAERLAGRLEARELAGPAYWRFWGYALFETDLVESYEKRQDIWNRSIYAYVQENNSETSQFLWNYNTLKDRVVSRGIPFYAVQYPMQPLENLKYQFEDCRGVEFIGLSYDEPLEIYDWNELFMDRYANFNYGHSTTLGNKIIARQIGAAILRNISTR